MDSWNYQPWVEDVNELAVAAFLQDRTTSQILQAAVQYRDQTVDVAPGNLSEVHFAIYPNPAGEMLYASFGSIQVQSRLELVDLNGKLILETVVPPGTTGVNLNIGSLGAGIYLVRWTESGSVLGMDKLIKIR
jgi:flagellar basal body rod protein FlgG